MVGKKVKTEHTGNAFEKGNRNGPREGVRCAIKEVFFKGGR